MVKKDSLTHAKHVPSSDTSQAPSWITRLGKSLTGTTLIQLFMVVFLLFVGFIVYGIGFMLRTESNINAWVAGDRSQLVTEMGNRLDILWRDYQVIDFIAQNPIIPVEPLASYGRILYTFRYISSHVSDILALQPLIIDWRENAQTQTVFPLLDRAFWHLEKVGAYLVSIYPSLERFT